METRLPHGPAPDTAFDDGDVRRLPATRRRSPTSTIAPFDPWRCSSEGTAARAITIEVVRQIETRGTRRRRQRKAWDAAIFMALVDAIIANLIRAHLRCPGGADEHEETGARAWVGIPLSARRLNGAARGRYGKSPVPLKSLPKRIGELEGLGLLILDKAPRWQGARRTSRIRAGAALVRLIEDHRPCLDDLGRCQVPGADPDDQQETIELRRKSEAASDWHREPASERLDYRDSEQTNKWRHQMARIFSATGLISKFCCAARSGRSP